MTNRFQQNSGEHATLMQAIREYPDEDGPRLIYADWLEERGDDGAEFIRTQIEQTNLPDDDPRHSNLAARELRMLKQYGPLWCGSHFVFKKRRFRRGFIEHVHLHLQHFLHHRRRIFALEPVRETSLTSWESSADASCAAGG